MHWTASSCTRSRGAARGSGVRQAAHAIIFRSLASLPISTPSSGADSVMNPDWRAPTGELASVQTASGGAQVAGAVGGASVSGRRSSADADLYARSADGRNLELCAVNVHGVGGSSEDSGKSGGACTGHASVQRKRQARRRWRIEVERAVAVVPVNAAKLPVGDVFADTQIKPARVRREQRPANKFSRRRSGVGADLNVSVQRVVGERTSPLAKEPAAGGEFALTRHPASARKVEA
ncbi:hypothetical protein C8F04DRAFT_1328145 [Mycena alexandri]|uniref:Uncharacterized protein n=1 Tax=Mycena alexandri TaxID=1745969 RepID=A0AAD6S099_9AGAR|nr:hypothetical protein C8F04DRAFT_1328145 [Mycena alexandri]